LKENRRYIFLGVVFILIALFFGLGSALSLLAQFFSWAAILLGAVLSFGCFFMALIYYYGYSNVKLGQDSYTFLQESMMLPENMTGADKEIQSLGFTLLGTIERTDNQRKRSIKFWVYRDVTKTSLALLVYGKSHPMTVFVSRYPDGLELEIVHNNTWAAKIDEWYLILRTVETSITVAHQFHQQMAYELALKHGAARRFESLQDSITEEETQFQQTKALYLAQYRTAARYTLLGLLFFLSGLLSLFVASIPGLLSAPLAIVAELLCLVLLARLIYDPLAPEEQRHLDASNKRKVKE
jgi:hypothetical protein